MLQLPGIPACSDAYYAYVVYAVQDLLLQIYCLLVSMSATHGGYNCNGCSPVVATRGSYY